MFLEGIYFLSFKNLLKYPQSLSSFTTLTGENLPNSNGNYSWWPNLKLLRVWWDYRHWGAGVAKLEVVMNLVVLV